MEGKKFIKKEDAYMEKNIREKLTGAGADVDQALERFLGNEAMYKKFALKFLEDENYKVLSDALERGDTQKAFAAAHTLKGVCGNLSFFSLYDAAVKLVAPLRAGNIEEDRESFPEFKSSYMEITKVLREWKE